MRTSATPLLHVVPNGLESPRRARVVLLLLPEKPGAADGAPEWLLEDWPQKAHEAFTSFFRGDGAEVVCEFHRPGGSHRLRGRLKDPLVGRPKPNLDQIKDLWTAAMGGNFVDLLQATTTDNAINSETLPLPTAEASLLLPLERARSALEALAPTGSPLLARSSPRPPTWQLAANNRPWLGQSDALVRLAAASTGGLSDAERRNLVGPPDALEWAQACLNGCVDPEHPFSKTLDPEAVRMDALGANGGDLLWLADRMHALRHAVFTPVAVAAPEPETDAAGRRLHQLLSSPGLMRLFGWARDAWLDFDEDLKEGRWGATLKPNVENFKSRVVAADVERELDGFFLAAATDWEYLLEGKGKPRNRAGVKLLSGDDAPKFAVTSLETFSAVEEDRQGSGARPEYGQWAPRLVTGPLALVRLGNETAQSPKSQNEWCFAEDLAAPDRLDLGIVLEDGTKSWHPTSARVIDFRDPTEMRDAGWPGKTIADLSADWMKEHEREVAGVATLKVQQITEPKDDVAEKVCPRATDPRVAAFGGEDLGANPNHPLTTSSGRQARWGQEPVILGEKGSDLVIRQSITVAERDLLPPLRFGWHYHFCLRRASLGGAGPRLETAKQVYKKDHSMPFPCGKHEAARDLRHEPVAKPLAMLPPDAPRGGAARAQTAAQMTVGTVEGSVTRVGRTARLFLPPPLPFNFVERHGVFDGIVGPERDQIEFTAAPEEGKNVVTQRLPIRAPRQGLVSAILEAETPRRDSTEGVAGQLPRLGVRGLGQSREVRKAPYYPDPAACFLVLRLAHPERVNDWLEDEPLIIRIRGAHGERGGARWPDILPLRLELEAATVVGGNRLTGGERSEERGPIMQAGQYAGIIPPTLPTRKATVRLAPGEEAWLRAWYVPDAEDLEAWFDIVACATGLCKTEGLQRKASEAEACRAGIKALLGLQAARGAERAAIAAALHEHLLREPLPGLVEEHRVKLLHAAVAPPAEAPRFVQGTARIARPASLEPEVLRPFLAHAGPAAGWPSTLADDGSTTVVVGGRIEFDAATISGLVVEALVRAPGSEALDPRPEEVPAEIVPPEPRPLRFGLSPDGEVRLPERPGSDSSTQNDRGRNLATPRWMTVLALKNIPVPADARAGRRTTILEDVLLERSPGEAGIAIEFGAPLEQPQAREVKLRVRGIQRHALSPTDAVIRPRQESETASLWIPATARPAAPDVRDMIPRLNWEEARPQNEDGTVVRVMRRATLRAWLRRPWFTSGEGERVALVMWPPAALDTPDGQALQMPQDQDALGDLTDEDLGPVGRFVSVWGHDPIMGTPSGEIRHRFLAPAHFPSIPLEGNFYPHALIPIAGMLEDPFSPDVRETMAAVSLLCLPLRFGRDVSDSWPTPYIDLDIALPGIASPLVRLGLVRFQPNARPDRRGPGSGRAGIRCSPPVTVQASLLPERRCTMRLTTLAARHGAESVLTVVSVDLAGPAEGYDGDPTRRRITFELRERRGGQEWQAATVDIEGKPQAGKAVWGVGATSITSHAMSGGSSRWTAIFYVRGNPVAEGRNLCAVVTEEIVLKNSAGDAEAQGVPRFAATLSLRPD